jgi:hypothetical protein
MHPLDSNHLVPGTPTFYPTLLAHVRELALPSMPLDSVVFQSILLCLIAGEKHLLLRAPEQDVRLVVKLAFLVSSHRPALGHQISPPHCLCFDFDCACLM